MQLQQYGAVSLEGLNRACGILHSQLPAARSTCRQTVRIKQDRMLGPDQRH